MNFIINTAYVLVLLAVLVYLLANIELTICKHKSKLVIDIPSISTMIRPEQLNLKYPIYIINKSRTKPEDIKYPSTVNKDNYKKFEIPIHIATKLNRPIKSMIGSVMNIPYTNLPIHTIYSGLNKSDELLNSINPLNSSEPSKYRILIANDDKDKIEMIIDDKIYFV